MLLRLFDASAPQQAQGWRFLAACSSGIAVQGALPAAVKADVSLNQGVLVVVWLLFQGIHSCCRDVRSRLVTALREEAKRVDSRLEVSSKRLVFSRPEIQVAYERWQGHRILDWVPNLIGVGMTVVVLVKMAQRAEICSLDTRLQQIPFLFVYLCRCVPMIWYQLPFAHRACVSIGLAHAGQWIVLVSLFYGDPCLPSLFQGAGMSLAGMLISLAMFSTVVYVVNWATVGYTEVHYGLVTAEYVAQLVAIRFTSAGTTLSSSEDVQRELAVLVLFAVVLTQLGCTGRHIVAKYSMSLFLESMSRQR